MNDTSFGLVPRSLTKNDDSDKILPIGTAVKIVDFDERPNGLLGITCEGLYKFKINESHPNSENLLLASVDKIIEEPKLSVSNDFEDLVYILEALNKHPYVKSLGYGDFVLDDWLADASRLGFFLSYLLPFNNDTRYKLLIMEDPLNRLQSIKTHMDNLKG
tara:strand:+ start:1270 stop:1752 length:483 start_codon:yes stop_codon:yes gene_type:complete